MNKNLDKKSIIHQTIKTLDDGKAENIKIFKCNPAYFVNYIILATCSSDRHIKNCAIRVGAALKAECAIYPNIDNEGDCWSTIDIGFAIVHIMNEDKSTNYRLDELMEEYGNIDIKLENL